MVMDFRLHFIFSLVFWTCIPAVNGFGGPTRTSVRRLISRTSLRAKSAETVASLKEELRSRGLKVSGVKSELKARLLDSDLLLAPKEQSHDAIKDTFHPFSTGASTPARAGGPGTVHLSKKFEKQYMGKDQPSSKVLFVGNLNLALGSDLEVQLQALFEAHGPVTALKMGTNKKTGAPAPFALVEFGTDVAATAASDALHGAPSTLAGSKEDPSIPASLRVEHSHQTGSASRARERNRCELTTARIDELVSEREDQRAQGFFLKSDRLRELLERKGVTVDDKLREWRTGDGRAGAITARSTPSAGAAPRSLDELLLPAQRAAVWVGARGKADYERGGNGDRRRSAGESAGEWTQGRGRGGDCGGDRRGRIEFGLSGHDYLRTAADSSPLPLPAAEIDALLAQRLQFKMKREFEAADDIQKKLWGMGIHLNDRIKEWRADDGADEEWRRRDRGTGGGG